MKKGNAMFVIGLTGGIGSGKTTVANLFATLGAEIIDADLITRELVLPGQKALTAIVQHCGLQILDSKGQLDRKQLREKIFQDKALKQWLEQLLHPLVRERMQAAIQASKAPYVILVIPLLIEALPHPLVQRICVVDVNPELQTQRVIERDKLNEIQVQSIIQQQASREQRLSHAQDIIENNGDLSQLHRQVESLHQLYLKLAKSAPAML